MNIAILPVKDGATLAIYSCSRIGKGDFGVNRKRVTALLDKLGRTDNL